MTVKLYKYSDPLPRLSAYQMTDEELAARLAEINGEPAKKPNTDPEELK